MWRWAPVAVLYLLGGWILSALTVWATWTHRISAIPAWLLSTLIVAAAVLLYLLSLLGAPDIVRPFLYPVPIGLLASVVVAAATAQWFAALSLGIGALLALYIRAASKGISDYLNRQPPNVDS